ncbi:MAG: zinc ABC transporter substrate-binding protein [Dehalococcoidia bacterium]|nr:zinc ABC transporter substrate-binding protein [Dehalococcoidia bacterium]
MSKGKVWFSLAVLLATAALSLASCATPARKTPISPKVTVVATFYPLQYLAQRIGGDRVEVTSLVPPGVEPHDFEPSPQNMAAVQRADIFLYNGAGLEPWADRVVAALPANGPAAVKATQGLALRNVTGNGDSKEGLDPHVWLDPRLYGQQAQLIHDAMVQADQAGTAVYDANLSNLQADLANLETEMRNGLASCRRDTIVSAHEAFGYMAERFGLRQLALAGLSPEVEPSPARMKELVQEVKDTGATYIFFESLTTPAVAEAIARETGAKTLEMNPLEGLTQDQLRAGEDYFTIMRQNLANLRTALDCK